MDWVISVPPYDMSHECHMSVIWCCVTTHFWHAKTCRTRGKSKMEMSHECHMMSCEPCVRWSVCTWWDRPRILSDLTCRWPFVDRIFELFVIVFRVGSRFPAISLLCVTGTPVIASFIQWPVGIRQFNCMPFIVQACSWFHMHAPPSLMHVVVW